MQSKETKVQAKKPISSQRKLFSDNFWSRFYHKILIKINFKPKNVLNAQQKIFHNKIPIFQSFPAPQIEKWKFQKQNTPIILVSASFFMAYVYVVFDILFLCCRPPPPSLSGGNASWFLSPITKATHTHTHNNILILSCFYVFFCQF